MKYKYVKIAAGEVQPTTGLVGAASEGSSEASTLDRIKGLLTDTSKDMADIAVDFFKQKSKQDPFQQAEDATSFGNRITDLKNSYVSSGFSPKEFDSFFPEFFNINNPSKVEKNPLAKNMDAKTLLDIMTQAKDDAQKANLPLNKIFYSEILLYSKTRNLELVKQVSQRAVALESEVTGIGIIESIINAIGGDTSETGMMMALLGTPELMREYSEIIAQATGHKLAPVELIIKDAEVAKSILNNQIIKDGLTRGIQNALESVQVRQMHAKQLEQLNNVFQNTSTFTGIFRNIFYQLWMADNLAVESSANLIPQNQGLKPSSLQKSSNSKRNRTVFAAVTPLSANQINVELTKMFNDSMTNTQRVFNRFYQYDASQLIQLVVKMKVARDTSNVTEYNALRPKFQAIIDKKNFRNDYNQEFCNTAAAYVQQMDANQPVTNAAVEEAEANVPMEEIEKIAPNRAIAERLKQLQQRYQEATETYKNIKSSIYGEPGANMIAGNAKELGQTKVVPYKSPEQVREKIEDAQESISTALSINREIASIYNSLLTSPAVHGSVPAEVINNRITRYKFNLKNINAEYEKLKADSFELKSEFLTVEETMKQRNERFMGGGQLAAQLTGLAATSKGTAYGLAGGVAELNRLLDSQIATQDDKIAKLEQALSSASSNEERAALEGQLQHAKIEKEFLRNKLFTQTNDALQGKFDPSFYVGAMESPGIAKASVKRNKFVLASKFIKESDVELEDYYNELYEDSEDSPEYGTALEHPKETRDILTKDIPKHKHKTSSKYTLN
jgi:hypothetical protein